VFSLQNLSINPFLFYLPITQETMTLTKEDWIICRRRNQLRRELRELRCWLQNYPQNTKQTEIISKKLQYGRKYRELDRLEWK